MTHRNTTLTTSKPGMPATSGKSTADTCLLAVRCPVYRSRDSNSGFRTELENLVGDAKGKGTSGSPMRPKVPMRRPGADCSVVVMNRVNSRGAKGAGHPRRDRHGPTGNRRSPLVSTEGGSLRWVARAVISREAYVRFCERPGMKFPGPTRRRRGDSPPYADSPGTSRAMLGAHRRMIAKLSSRVQSAHDMSRSAQYC
jgi:hypothetical protein